MAIHYNAFISYRHHPDDIRVASEIHRSLERFHVPLSIRKRTGKIERLFRDKEELPITSNLTDDIDEALKNSDYLIVICSVHTKESAWVLREIELFLQTHPRNKVLTVLASGEPYDVIPEILLYEDVTDPVTGETVRKNVEPLSCDWRMKHRKALQEELPRLAAVLLGCSYDELRQRQRQYRARRNMSIVSTALAASLCLTAYFLHTSITIRRANEQITAANIQIQANLDEALRNQSLHLSTAAQERLAEGDRLTAIALASAALPSQSNPRPFVPEAEKVLTDALGLYSTTNRTVSVGTISPSQNVQVNQFWVTEDDSILYLRDQRYMISAWDTHSLQKLGDVVQLDTLPSKLLTLPDGNAVIIVSRTASCYRPDGTLLWQLEGCRDMVYLEQEGLLLGIRRSEHQDLLLQVDPASGKILGEPLDLLVDGYGTDFLGDPAMYPTEFLADPASADMPVVIGYYESYSSQSVYIIDLRTGRKTLLPAPTAYPQAALLTEDGRFIMIGEAEGNFMTGHFDNNRVNSPMHSPVLCYDTETGALLWESEIVTSTPGSASLQKIPGSRNILCQDGSVFQVMDPDSGQVLACCDAGSNVIAVEKAGENYVRAILEDGCTCNYWYADNYCYAASCMAASVSMAAIGKDSWYVHYLFDDHLTVYRTVRSEPDWVSEVGSTGTPRQQSIRGSRTVFLNYYDIYLFDAASRQMVWQAAYEWQTMLGFSQNGTKLWYTDEMQSLTAVDTATGETETLALPLPEGASAGHCFLLSADHVYYITDGAETPLLNILELSTGEAVTCPLILEADAELASCSNWQALDVQGSFFWFWDGSTRLLEADLNTGAVRCVYENLQNYPDIALREDGTQAAITVGSNILIRTPGAGYSTVFTSESGNPVSVRYRGEDLLVLCDNSYLYRLDSTGQCLSRTHLVTNGSLSDSDLARIIWQFTADDRLILSIKGTANVIDCSLWAVRASIDNFLMYDEATGDLICRLADAICGYRLQDTRDLLKLAEEALNGFRLTREQKTAYGIQ